MKELQTSLSDYFKKMQEITDFLWKDDFLHIHNIRKTENVYAKFEKIHRRTSLQPVSFCCQVQRKMIRY